MKLNFEISNRTFLIAAYVVVLCFSFFPLLFSFPFRIHLDLPYEGAYRLYLGQLPYKDFGMPFGYGFFMVPTAFFYLFGPHFTSLLYAQTFLNIVSGCAVISICKSLKFEKSVLFIAALVYAMSYIFIYFWPWHTHTAYTYGLVAIAIIVGQNVETPTLRSLGFIALSAVFSFLSLFTKQDYGGLSLLFCLALLLAQAVYTRQFKPILAFGVSYVVTALVFIAPLLKLGFGYWFNHGQPPHSSRMEPIDFLNEFFLSSDWEKFYLLAFLLVLVSKFQSIKQYEANRNEMIAFLVCTGMVVEALLTKVTSRMSTGTTTYYHAFAVAYILQHVSGKVPLKKVLILLPFLVFLFLWWSPMYWKYASRIFPMPQSKVPRQNQEAKVQVGWELSEFKTLRKIKLPVATIEGMRRLKALPVFAKPDSLQVFNMTELTSLPEELHYTPLKGIPLWFDLGVAIFPQQVDEIRSNIAQKKYDVFLFEKIPLMDNFYPEDVRLALQQHYKLADTFLAPRKEEDATIEVYIKP